MGEYKRIFLDGRRMVLFAIMTVLCGVLFLASLLTRIEPGAFGDMVAAQEAVQKLCSDCRGKSFEEIRAVCEEYENAVIDYCIFLRRGAAEGGKYSSLSEANEDISNYFPRFVSLSDDSYAIGRFGWTALDAVYEVRDLALHLSDYADYLDSIQEQAARTAGVGIFQKKGGFSSKNIQKTAEDFAKLDGSGVSFANNASLEHWLAYEFADYFFLAMIVIIVLAFLDERRNGLWHAVRSCRKGRASLGLTRLGILAAGSVLAVFLVYLLPLLLSCAFSGGPGDLGRPIQSLESFRRCSAAVSVGGWLAGYFFLKALSGIVIGLLLWCVLGSLANPQFSLGVLGATLAGEYGLYRLVPVQSAASVLKYLNIFSYIRISELYSNYFNINLFGAPVSVREIILASMPVLLAAFAFWAVLMQAKRRPEGNRDVLSRIAAVCNRFFDFFRSRFTVGGWELYKTLVYESGILMAAAVVIFSGALNFRGLNSPGNEVYMFSTYMRDLEGVIDGGEEDYFRRARESADGYQAEDALLAIDLVEAKVAELKERAEAGGYEPWVVYGGTYNLFYGSAADSVQRLNAAAAILFTVLLTAAVFAYERQSGVTYMLRSMKRGRYVLFRRKALAAVLAAAVAWASVYLRELYDFLNYCHPQTLGAPVQNIDELSRFPLKMSIVQYLAVLYGMRFVMLCFVSFAVLLISRLSRNVLGAYLAGTAVLALPALFLALGFDEMKYVSFVLPVSSAEVLWKMGDGSLWHALPWAAGAAAGTAAVLAARRTWCGGLGPTAFA